jgi:hypothetical protein
MFNQKLMKCPNCDSEMERGFSIKNSPLSFVTPGKMDKFVHMDEDLNRAGVKTIVPAKATYNAAYRCAGCKIVIIDYSRVISSKEAKAEAASMR